MSAPHPAQTASSSGNSHPHAIDLERSEYKQYKAKEQMARISYSCHHVERTPLMEMPKMKNGK